MKALVIGATGLVGSEIVQQLIENPKIASVETFVRRKTDFASPKLTQHIVDFKTPEKWKHLVKGDIAFSAMGTTKATAGSIEAQYEVDYTYQANFAKVCAENRVPSFVLISSMGANHKSAIPYSKMKGELDNYVQSLGFKNVLILRPGPLEGPRKENRPMENILIPTLKFLSKVPGMKVYQPVHGRKVAFKAIQAGLNNHGSKILEAAEILGY